MIREKAPVKFRHELKHIISITDDYLLSNRLKKLFKYDSNANSHGVYHVSSLYFDTPYDKALRQKIDGVNNREKFRIRYYNDNVSFIRLEKKIKKNGLCAKYNAKLSLEQTQLILNGEIDFLKYSQNPVLIEFYSKMKGELLSPKTIIRYERQAFLFESGNVRITIDRDIFTGLRATDFLNPNLKLIKATDNLSILEVKYDEFLPDIVRLSVQIPNRKTCSFSKYSVSRRFD